MIEESHREAYTARKPPGKAAAWIKDASRAAINFVYPPLCPLCREETAATGGVCASCWRDVVFISGHTCKVCGAPVGSGGSSGRVTEIICDGCAHAPPAWSAGAAAVAYSGAGRRAILALKHGDRLDIAPLAARWMLKAGRRLIEDTDLIVPAPLHWKRLARRKYNQAGELAREIACAAGRKDRLALDLLERTRATPSMDGRDRRARYMNVADAFAATSPDRIAGKTVLLIDDVLTTGATLSTCAEVCREAGAKDVNALVFARVARADWPS